MSADCDTDNWNQVTSGWLASRSLQNTSRLTAHAYMEKAAKREITELTQRWHRTLGSKHKHLLEDINATSLPVNLFHGCTGANGLCSGSRRNTAGGAVSTAGSPSCVTATSLLCHMPLHTRSHLLTHVPKLSIWTGEKRKRPSACINQAAKATCCITAGAPEAFLSPCMSQGEIKKNTHMQCDCWCVSYSDAWRTALSVKGRGHLAPKNYQAARSTQILWSLFAFIPKSEEKQPWMGNIISLKTSFSVYYLQRVTDKSAKAGNLISECPVHFPCHLLTSIICRTVASSSS